MTKQYKIFIYSWQKEKASTLTQPFAIIYLINYLPIHNYTIYKISRIKQIYPKSVKVWDSE